MRINIIINIIIFGKPVLLSWPQVCFPEFSQCLHLNIVAFVAAHLCLFFLPVQLFLKVFVFPPSCLKEHFYGPHVLAFVFFFFFLRAWQQPENKWNRKRSEPDFKVFPQMRKMPSFNHWTPAYHRCSWLYFLYFFFRLFYSIVIVIAVAEVAYNNNNKTSAGTLEKFSMGGGWWWCWLGQEKVALFGKVFSVVWNSFRSLSSRLYVEFFSASFCCRVESWQKWVKVLKFCRLYCSSLFFYLS